MSICFVLMPFRDPFNRYYDQIIAPAVSSAGLTPRRADHLFRPSPIMEDIWEMARSSEVIVAELTAQNANVFYELGLAHAIGKPVILLSETMEDVPFDLRALRVLTYQRADPQWGEKLRQALERSIKETLAEPSRAVPATFRTQGRIEARVGPHPPGDRYHWHTLLGRVHRELYIAGPNLRSWLNDDEIRLTLLKAIQANPSLTVNLILGTPPILRTLEGEGEEHLKQSVRDLRALRDALTSDTERARFRCFFHFGAATLSAVFCDPKDENGVVRFAPRWGTDHLPQRRLTCVIERRHSPDLFDTLFDSPMVQRNVQGLDDALRELGEA